MVKTKRAIEKDLKLIDIVIEILDARIPKSSKNPDIDSLIKNKPRIVLLNKIDLADPEITKSWFKHFKEQGSYPIGTDSTKGTGFKDVWALSSSLMAEKLERLRNRGRIFTPTRAMIVGIPNVGKSTLINKYVKKAITKVENRPGVTRSNQWIKINKEFELLDTPGILPPKIEDPHSGVLLALCSAVKGEILDSYQLSLKLIEVLEERYKGLLESRFKIDIESADLEDILSAIGSARGYKLKGDRVDLERTAHMLLTEFKEAKLGRISLESPIEYQGE